jgi:hypothetical protein
MYDRAMRALAMAATLVVSGCTLLIPDVDCNLPARCSEVVTQGNQVLPRGAERIVVTVGRAPSGVFHAEVHACYRDGRYSLVDVIGSEQGALDPSIRSDPPLDPPCR